MDFIVDGLATGRMVRILSVVDAYTRECLALEADTSLGSGLVTRALEQLIEERGRPESLRSDNGPEFCSRRMLGWAEEFKVELVHGHVESFHGGCAMSASTHTGSAPCTISGVHSPTGARSTTASALIARLPIALHRSSERHGEGSRAMALLPSPTTTSKPTENLQL